MEKKSRTHLFAPILNLAPPDLVGSLARATALVSGDRVRCANVFGGGVNSTMLTAGSAGNQPPVPLGGGMLNSIKSPWIRARKIGGFLLWGGPR